MSLDQKTGEIIGIAYEVTNEIGSGFREKACGRAMLRELQPRSIACDPQKAFPLVDKDTIVDELTPDLIVFDEVIADTKTTQFISDREPAQMLSYLKATGLPIGFIANFGNPKVEIERVHPLRH